MAAGRKVAFAAALGLGAGVVLAGAPGVLAGHTNPVLEATLDGRSEVATGATSSRIVGDPNGRGEAYVFGIDENTGDPDNPRTTLCYVMTVDKIAPATMAHIHKGGAGTNGPVVVNLARPTDGNSADCLREGEVRGGVPVISGTTVEEILADPDAFYVNVHNEEYPGGAVRGQLGALN